MEELRQETINRESDDLGKKITPIPKPETNIGIDTRNVFYDNIVDAGTAHAIDISEINSFSQISNNRETLYQVLDTMGEDPTIASMLEIYTEDATETNDTGRIVWAESSDPDIAKYVEFLLKSLNVDKNIYKWTYSLIKYGDVYLKLFHQSDFEDELFKDDEKQQLNEAFNQIQNEPNKTLNEDVVIRAYSSDDKLVNYIEMVPNPGEMFELTKFGKSYAYIKTNTVPTSLNNYNNSQNVKSAYYTYKFKRQDIQIFNAVSFVHGALQDDTPRAPEQIQIFKTDAAFENESEPYTYTVRRGQSILFNVYKIWRQMMLLENALLLNRLTKSSILRVIEVEVADMPKERVGPHLQRIKSLVEQKASISTGDMMSEYTNPGAMENNIYVPTHNGIGAIQTQQIGGDVNVKDIADIDYFKNKFYSASKIPKQFLGDTDDATGFNGGTSLSIVSSRYAKTIKRIQATMCQCLTDVINILLIDRGLNTYVNKFVLRMQPPVTQEELDKRDNTSAKIALSDDVLRMLDAIEDPVIKLKITKSLLANAISNSEVIDLIQEYIDNVEEGEEEAPEDDLGLGEDDDFGLDDLGGFGGGSSSALSEFDNEPDTLADFDTGDLDMGTEVDTAAESSLPSPADLGVGDMSDML